MKNVLFSLLLTGLCSIRALAVSAYDVAYQRVDPTVSFLETFYVPFSTNQLWGYNATAKMLAPVTVGSGLNLDTSTWTLTATGGTALSQSVRTSYSFGTAVQLSTTQDGRVNASCNISCTMSLTSGQEGKISLEISPNGSTGWTTIGEGSASNSGSLTIGLNLTQKNPVNISGDIPAGYYYRLSTSNVTGTPTFTFNRAQEVLN